MTVDMLGTIIGVDALLMVVSCIDLILTLVGLKT